MKYWSNCDIFVAPNYQRLALHLSKRPGLLSKDCIVVHNSPSHSNPSTITLGDKAELAIGHIQKARQRGLSVVVYSGAVGVRYGIQTLVSAVVESDRCFLLILGKQHDLALREVTEVLPNVFESSRVSWIDEVPYAELFSVISQGDIGFVHYHGDNLNTRFSAPGKLYEYLRAGLAVVTDDGQELAPQIELSQSGAVISRPIAVRSLVNVLNRMTERPDVLVRMKSHARLLFRDHYCIERQMVPLLSILKDRLTKDSAAVESSGP
jgi:hypothetical protein